MSKTLRPHLPVSTVKQTAYQPLTRQAGAKPVAPPVYRPQATPKVLQRKVATTQPAQKPHLQRQQVAPPVYQPQPVPRALQRKELATRQPHRPAATSSVAPAVYRPQPVPKCLQMKKADSPSTGLGTSARQPAAPPNGREEIRKVESPKLPAHVQTARRGSGQIQAKAGAGGLRVRSISERSTLQCARTTGAHSSKGVIQRRIDIQPHEFIEKRTRGVIVAEAEMKKHVDAYLVTPVNNKGQKFSQVVSEVVLRAKELEHRRSVARDQMEFWSRYNSGRYDEAADMLWTIAHFINALYDTYQIGGGNQIQPLVTETLPPSVDNNNLGGQAEKAKRERANKKEGQEPLIKALDLVESNKQKDMETTINGFTIAKKGKQLMVVLYRKMSPSEASGMKSTSGISRKQFTDSYKWFSESNQHSESFSNSGGSKDEVIYKIYVDADDYLKFRKKVEPEFGNTGATTNRFHQEKLGTTSKQINMGIHGAEEEEFNKTIIKMEPLKK